MFKSKKLIITSFMFFLCIGLIGGCESKCEPFALFCSDNDIPIIDHDLGFPSDPGSGGFGGGSSLCEIGEKWCGSECIPFEVDCCYDSLSEFVGSCTISKPVCCPSGICVTDFELCPNVTECPEHRPQPCGPICIGADDTCCVDSDVLSCWLFHPVCCPKGSPYNCSISLDGCDGEINDISDFGGNVNVKTNN